MIVITRGDEVELVDWGWIQMRSPVLHDAPYGTLAVFTDGEMHPGQGFDMHPHRNLEIVSVILEGEVTHRDSTGNVTRMGAGSVQRITAGSGIFHAEHTTSPQSVRMFQIWFIPTTPNLPPGYARADYTHLQPKNTLYPIVYPAADLNPVSGALVMQADGRLFMADMEPGETVRYTLNEDRKLFVYATNGQTFVNGLKLAEQDHARISDESEIEITADTAAQCIVIEVPKADGRLR
jgi:redox-sensitive bicupin YhaK (pirin superfamily)